MLKKIAIAAAALVFGLARATASDLEAVNDMQYSDGATASYCLIFSDPLDPKLTADDLKPYLTLTSQGEEVPFEASAEDRQLCLSGLENSQSYKLVLKAGFEALNGATLKEDIVQEFTAEGPAASLRFEDGAILHPSLHLKLHASGMDSARLFLYRLNDADLSALLFANLLQEPKSIGNLSSVVTARGSLVRTEEIELDEGDPGVDLKDFVKEKGLYYAAAMDSSLKPQLDDLQGRSLYELSNQGRRWDARLLLVTDLSLVLYRSLSGISVQALSYEDGSPLKRVEVKLVSRNAAVLGRTLTDQDGFASFDANLLQGEGGDEPVYVTASLKDDFALVDLRQRPVSLENLSYDYKDRPLQAVVYTDRDLYRKGETVYYSVYLRDLKGRALKGQRLDLEILSPQGSLIETVHLEDEGGGRFGHSYAIGARAPAGTYTLRLKTPGGELADVRQFEVMSLVPRTVSAEVNAESTAEGQYRITLEAAYNYGVQAGGLSAQGSLALGVDHAPFDNWQDFSFGEDPLFDSAAATAEALSFDKTDAEGKSSLEVAIASKGYAQVAQVQASVFELNGQEVASSHSFKVPGSLSQIGLKRIGAGLDFKAVLTDPSGNLMAGTLDYALYKVERTMQYVFSGGRWDQRTVQRQRAVKQGRISCDGTGPADLSFEDLNEGLYLLRVREGDSSSSLYVSLGVSGSPWEQGPASIDLFLDKEEYAAGDTLKASFESPVSGRAAVAQGRYGLDSLKTFKVKKGRNEIELKLDEEAVPVSNLILSVYDEDGFESLCPRYVGTASFKVKDKLDDLLVQAQIPELVKPGEEAVIKIKAENVTGSASAELFLVDKGILDISNFVYQDPASVLAKEGSCGVELYDQYGFLITRSQGYGSDEGLFKGLSGQSLSALSSSLAAVHKTIELKEGDNEISFAVPDFDGALVAALILSDDHSLRLIEDKLTVHSDLTLSFNTPVYLQEGDEAQASFLLHNHEESTGFEVAIDCSGALQCSFKGTLDDATDALLPVTLQAGEAGIGTIKAKAVRTDGRVFETARNMAVQSLSPAALENFAAVLSPGEKAVFDAGRFKRIDAAGGTLSAVPGLSFEALLKEVDKSSPVTLFDKAALLKIKLALPLDAKARGELQDLVDELCLSSYANGFFGSDLEGSWSQSLYVTEVLFEAQQNGYKVGRELLERSLDTVQQELRWLSPLETALAYDLLLKAGRNVDLSLLRYFFDEGKIANAQAWARLSQIFAALGDVRRARTGLERGLSDYRSMQDLEALLQKERTERGRHELEAQLSSYKNSLLNDELNDLLELYQAAAALADKDETREILLKIAAPLQRGYLSLLNLESLCSLQGESPQENIALSFDPQVVQEQGRVEAVNNAERDLFALITLQGELKEQRALEDPRLEISKEYFDEHGRALNPPFKLKQGERVVVKLAVNNALPSYEKIAATDLLSPAFVYEGELSAHALRQNIDWGDLNQSFVREQEEDDRLLFLLNYQKSFVYFYVLRASCAGTFSLPPLQAQSLHSPQVLSRTGILQGALTVEP